MPPKPRVVVALLDEGQEFQRMQAEDARMAAAETGLEAQVVFAENSPILQIQQLYKAIQAPDDQRPRAILVETVSGDGAERVAKAALRAGIGWVLINRMVPYLPGLRRDNPGLPVSTVSTDQVEIGRIQGRQFRALIPSGEGLVLYVQGPGDTSAAVERLQGAREEIGGTRIELKVVDGQWTEASGEQGIAGWLRLKRLDKVRPKLVGCQNDAMAVGARRALAAFAAEPELARLPITGVDGLPGGGQRLVREGQLAATVIVPSSTGPAIRLVAMALLRRAVVSEQNVLKPASYPEIDEIARRAAGRRSPP